MKRVIVPLFIGCLLPLTNQDSVAQPFVHGTYYVCDMTQQDRADEIVEQVIAGIIDGQVSTGVINAWGWLSHYNGGRWRRVLYMVGDDVGGLSDARDNLIETLQSEHSSASKEFTSICNTHDDYIWSFVTGSESGNDVATDRPTAGFSVYLECDASREDRADELVTGWAETMNGFVSEGTINSWAYWAHLVGGKYGRLFLFDGDSHNANLSAVQQVVDALKANHADGFSEHSEICSSHQDYMWDIEQARP